MKTSINIALITAAIVVCSCERISSHKYGDSIYFTASAERFDKSYTKTEYSGVVNNGVERIDWVDGDRISIYCYQAADNDKSSDYVINSTTIASNGRYSSASIEPADGNGLHWGSGTHYFYAVYPDNTFTGNGNTASLSCTVPYNQTGVADMDNAYMYAIQSVSPTDPAVVLLDFNPMFTAYEFTVSGDAAMTITDVVLSSVSGNLSGNFTATMRTTGISYSYSSGTNDNKVHVDLSGISDKTVGPSKSMTFTVLAPPSDVSGMRAKFTTSEYGVRQISMRNADKSDIVFNGTHKIKISGLEIPNYVWVDIVAQDDTTNTYEPFTSKPYIDFSTDTDHGFEEGDHAGEQIDFPISGNVNEALLVDFDANQEHLEAFQNALDSGETLYLIVRYYVAKDNNWSNCNYWLHIQLYGFGLAYQEQQNFQPVNPPQIERHTVKLEMTQEMLNFLKTYNRYNNHEGMFHVRGGGNITIEGIYVDVED